MPLKYTLSYYFKIFRASVAGFDPQFKESQGFGGRI